MKRYMIIVIVLLVCNTSCQKFLNTEPTNFITPEYQNIAQLETGLAGVYDVLGTVYQDDWPYWLNATSDIEYDRTGQQNSTIYIYSPADIRITSFWRVLYQGVYRANVILEAVKNPNLPEEKARIEGEALFLRAYYNFLLVSNFGNVPLLLTADPSITELNVPATPMKDIYDQVVADMIKAESLVDAAGDGKATFGGRISKSAVQGILARVYLKMAGYPLNGGRPMYEEALRWAKKVEDSGLHALAPDYREIFKRYARDEYDIKESIWEVEYYGNGTGGLQEYTYYVGARCGILSVDLEIGRSGGLIMASKKLFDLYGGTTASSPDIRRDWNIATYSWGGSVPGVYTPITDLFRRYAGKWRREYETLTPKGNNVSGQNFPILRYADILLMIAEAENELNGPDNAYQYVNDVRRRGYGILHGNTVKTIIVTNGGSGYTSTPTITIEGGLINATAVVSAGVVTEINITDHGTITQSTGYVAPPVITISGGGGSGATAEAVLTQSTDADLTVTETASAPALLQAIKDERAREFCFEASRRPDLIRWGSFVRDIRQYAIDGRALGMSDGMVAWTNNVTERSVLLPIPIYDLTLNKALEQNPGY
ncbi:RagB/SusD family nutrient uptake outer membrane protein [Sphingobacterium phlebotomi]|uniref:RagB/SusD family nutrient uptake outer membrane protein n=1 Tax=Sphingobacterium phlebotomi TaxID=2605433 RepID=A0A5D4HG16_9SPHI|nr:RagB/SusD family nutrient uptake outer membrane protein [Sphingobacterium phlebotomi]TYR37760.1 RagB/SusD family nutrient uptake outer membrane protein [Sphingobacterium phlebotomi]